jgi:hypothetical protein
VACQISDALAKKVVKDVNTGKTYQSIGDKHGISVATVYKCALRSGKKSGWKRAELQAKQRSLHARVKVALNKTPNLYLVCQRLGAPYWNIATHPDFCLRNDNKYRRNRIKFLEAKRPIHSDLIAARRKKVKG